MIIPTFILAVFSILFLSGCHSADIRKTCDNETIAYGEAPAFGSLFSGGSMMMAQSAFVPAQVANEPGTITGGLPFPATARN